MAKYTKETVIETAKIRYFECEKVIRRLIVFSKLPDLETKVDTAMTCFDLIIQTCLVAGSAVDGKLADNELYFITKIAKYGDIVDYVNDKMAIKESSWRNLTWKDIATYDGESLKKFASLATVLLEPMAELFVKIFAGIDSYSKYNHREMLLDRVATFFVGLSGIDGDDVQSDNAVAVSNACYGYYNYLVEEKWKKIINK